MKGCRLPDNTQPKKPGEYSFMRYADRQVHHPDEQGEGEWWVCDPRGSFYRLVSRVHSWIVHGDGTVTFSPSIVAPRGGYHGYLRQGVWS
jgi:hypothetical protein